MDTRQLEYILMIAEEKNLSRAAERLFLTQSALSQQLAKLEAEGLPPLFVHNRGEMLLTDAGKIYINGARTILKINRDAEEALKDLSTSKVHHLHIGVCRSLQPFYYAHVLPWLKHAYPDVEITTLTPRLGQVRHLIEDGEMDLVMYAAKQTNELLKYIPLQEEELVMAVLPSRDSIPLPIALPAQGTHLRLLADEALAAAGLHPPVYAEPEDIHAAITLAELGECAAILPRNSVSGTKLSWHSLTPAFIYQNALVTRRGTAPPMITEICQWIIHHYPSSIPQTGMDSMESSVETTMHFVAKV